MILRISAVLPAYNEEGNLPRTIPAVVQTLSQITSDFEVLVVDDGSRDRTAEVAQELAARYPQLRVIRHEANKGYGGALWTGFTSATRDLIFFTDADYQFDIADLHRLIPHIGEYDLVIGYRSPRRDRFVRKLNALGWKLVVHLLFGYTARDVDCAFKLFRREVIEVCPIESRGATFSAELLIKARAAGFCIKEVPVKHLPRTIGSATGARPAVILRAFKELIRFRLTFDRRTLEGSSLRAGRPERSH
ncbi:MAG: glycosyltransferase family 2 protein [Chloroflexi bacterium]|nr:glycosyltransferase family 2 protein [Chloroflexota bacterium]